MSEEAERAPPTPPASPAGPAPAALPVKTVDEVDMEKYHENEGNENPYYRKFGVKKKSYFSHSKSQIFDSDEEKNMPEPSVTSNQEVDTAQLPAARASVDMDAVAPAQPAGPNPLPPRPTDING